jgi:DNA-directed RNA polymerase specialized sigma24 family protein
VSLDRKALLSDPALIAALGSHVRSRVPAADADDVVQAVLADALIADTAPGEAEALRRWLFGVARHKIADFYRKNRREEVSPDVGDVAQPSSGRAVGHDLLEWAEQELPPGSEAKRTFEWMLREGEGEKLESIAASEKLPAPRVRKRVSRMREHFRARWAAYVAGIAAAGLAILIAFYLLRKKEEPIARVVPETVPHEIEMARKERQHALEDCDRSAWKECLDGLDRAAASDPAGDTDARVASARDAAHKALTPVPLPSPSATVVPTARPIPTPTVVPTSMRHSMSTPVSSTSM